VGEQLLGTFPIIFRLENVPATRTRDVMNKQSVHAADVLREKLFGGAGANAPGAEPRRAVARRSARACFRFAAGTFPVPDLPGQFTPGHIRSMNAKKETVAFAATAPEAFERCVLCPARGVIVRTLPGRQAQFLTKIAMRTQAIYERRSY